MVGKEAQVKSNLKGIIYRILAVVALFVVGQVALEGGLIDSFYQINIFLIGINIILAVSLNLINGYTGQFSIGHAGFMAVGAYVATVLTMKLGYPFAVALLVGSLSAGLAGFLIGLPTLRLRGDYLAIATLGFGEIIRVLLLNIEYVGGAAGIIGIPRQTNWAWLYFSCVLTIVVITNLINSSHGRAFISIREDEIAAETMGINTTRYKVMAFSIGAFFAGLAGGLYAHYFFLIQPSTFSFLKSFDILVMVVLGGLGSTTGSILAAIVLTLVSAALASFAEIRMVLYAIVLIILMLYRPQGMMGNKELSLSMLRLKRGDRRDTAVGE
ncbi:MAG: branched-chain amino acid ABC transporter permease [Firmicutes bacterium]|nr:branched-chain amino acid ABC transporter permease [Bacillota bacterium]